MTPAEKIKVKTLLRWIMSSQTIEQLDVCKCAIGICALDDVQEILQEVINYQTEKMTKDDGTGIGQ